MAKWSKVNITFMAENMPSLLDSGSMVSLMWQTYFNRYLSHSWDCRRSCDRGKILFDLNSANSGGIPLSRYVELDIEFSALEVPGIRFLITQNPNEVLDPEH